MRDACKKDIDDAEDELDPKDNKNLAEMDDKRNLRPWLVVRFTTFITITNFTLITSPVIFIDIAIVNYQILKCYCGNNIKNTTVSNSFIAMLLLILSLLWLQA